MLKCNSLVINGDSNYQVMEFSTPEIKDSYLLLEVMLSPLTEMDAFGAENNKDYAFIPGSEMVGVVRQAGARAAAEYCVNEGDLVYVEPSILCGKCKYCLTGNYSVCREQKRYGHSNIEVYPYLSGGFSKYVVIQPGSRVHKIPKEIPVDSFAMTGTIARAFRAVSKKGSGCLGKSVLIIGFDIFGICSGIVAGSVGFGHIEIYDSNLTRSKIRLAEKLGLNVTGEFNGSTYDLIIDNLGDQSVFQKALGVLNPLGKYVVALNHKTDNYAIPVRNISQNEVEIIGVSMPSWDVEQALMLIKTNHSIVNRIDKKICSLQDFAQAMEAAGNKEEITSILIKP